MSGSNQEMQKKPNPDPYPNINALQNALQSNAPSTFMQSNFLTQNHVPAPDDSPLTSAMIQDVYDSLYNQSYYQVVRGSTTVYGGPTPMSKAKTNPFKDGDYVTWDVSSSGGGDLEGVIFKVEDAHFGYDTVLGLTLVDTGGSEKVDTWWNNFHQDKLFEGDYRSFIIVKDYTLTPIVKPDISMESVIMAEHKKDQIRQALAQTEHHDKIFNQWGLGLTLEKGMAIALLFWGPPGTGKTLMGEAIANQLNAKLQVVSVAEIQSSEPGEAERTIQAIFETANKEVKNSKPASVLLFDECDSLLTDRNELGPILGATVNCLLGEIERYKGVIIFTTNRLGKLDPALERRLSAKIEFDFPTLAMRADIWKRIVPEQCPLEADVDFMILAEIEIAGGNIKNAVLNAARRAAYEKKDAISLDHFRTAAIIEAEGQRDWVRQASRHDHTRQIYGGNASVSMSTGVKRIVRPPAITRMSERTKLK